MTFLFGSRSEKMQTFEKSSMKEFKRFPQSILEIHRVDVVHTAVNGVQIYPKVKEHADETGI